MVRFVTVLAALSLVMMTADGGPVSNRRNWYGSSKPQVDTQFQSAKTKVTLDCSKGKMEFRINFVEPFGGVIQIGSKSCKECTIRGDNSRTSYVLSVSPDSCGSCKNHNCSNGSFINTLYIRFHRTLERDGDEVKTVICKYQAGSIQAG